ncbi:MAG: Ig-like domain-containing protein [bacterium]|nr:Ig-like domain-containing protein [bacterium]
MKKRMIPVVALSALICLGGLSAITSCSSISDGGTQEPVGEVKVTITSTISKVKVGETVTLTCSVTGTNDTAVTWSVNAGAEYLEVVDASKGEFKGLAIGSAKVKVSLVADPTKSAIVSITVTAATDVDPDALVTIESITKTKDSSQFVETTIQGTLVSLYAEGTAYSGLIYDGTAVMPLFKFASKTEAEKLKIGDVLKVKGTPSRYKDYYWAQMDGSGSNITSFNVVEGATKNELPAAVNWTGADSAAYTESDSTDFKHVICDVIAVKSGTYTNFKIIGSSDTDRLLGLQYTPSDAPYVAEGTKSRMEFVTGDLKNSETIVSMYPINIELIGYSLSAESTDIKVGETTKLTLSNAGTAVTEGITWASSDETIATVADGTVTGVKEGKVTITATVGTESATLDINVLPKIVDYTSEATTKTIAECNAEAGDESKLYIVEGKISEVKNAGYGSFYMTADGNAATGDDALYVYGSCFGQEALSFAGSKWSYNYKNGYAREDFYTVGQTVKILCFRVDYNGTKEVKGVILTEDPYWLAKKATVDEILEGDLDASKLYFTEAYVTSIERVSYGRFHSSANDDGTGTDLYVYSSGIYKEDPTALSKKDDGTWNYDFNKATAPSETTLTVGDKVTLVVYRADFNGTKEVKGVIYDIEAGELK